MPSLWDLIKYRSTVDDGTVYTHLTSELGNPIVVTGVIDADSVNSGYTADFILDVLAADFSEEYSADVLTESSAEAIINATADAII